jgi:FKBP-type peptidyl-prolyl cis-trans isomerase
MKIQMRRLAVFAGVLFLMGSAACAQKNDRKGKAEFATAMDSISYVFGASLGQNIRQAEINDVNNDMVMRGFEDAMKGDSTMVISMEDGNMMVRNFMQGQAAEKAKESVAKSEAYMAERAGDDAYQSTESGMLYKVTTPGDGPMPVATDVVKVNYEGKTTDGEVFDSSYERGQPAEFPLNRVIPGWTEILQLMNVGSTVEVIIPPALAYGERGSPPNIGPNEVLIFKIELLEIMPAQTGE